jgi:hypothetical protein
MMASLAISNADDDLEFEWIAAAGSLDLNHGLPSSQSVTLGSPSWSGSWNGATAEERILGNARAMFEGHPRSCHR